MKNKNSIFLSIGTNIGNKLQNIRQCINLLKINNINIVKNSAIFKTEPIGNIEQDDFYNIVLKCNCDYKPRELLDLVKKIEKQMGRKKTIHWGPRIIDIDILIYNDIIIKQKDLTIPHKEIINRLFVLKLIEEIEDIILPNLNMKVSEVIMQKKFKQKIEKVKYINFT